MSPIRILILFIAMIALALSMAACGGSSGNAQQIVDEATLEGVESGNLDLSIGIDAKGDEGGHLDIGLSGPFQAENGSQPTKLDLTATAQGAIGGKNVDFKGGVTLLGNRKAYVNYEGTEYKVDPTTYGVSSSLLEETEEISSCQEVLDGTQLSDFIEDPTEEGEVEVGDTSTTKVSAGVDTGTATEVLTEMSEDALCNEQLHAVPGFKQSLTELERSKDKAQESIKDASVVLYVGDDHIVRRLQAKVMFEPPAGSGAESAESAEIDIDLTLTGVNESQTISAPSSAKPLSALFVKLGVNPIELLRYVQGGVGGVVDRLLEGTNDAGGTQ